MDAVDYQVQEARRHVARVTGKRAPLDDLDQQVEDIRRFVAARKGGKPGITKPAMKRPKLRDDLEGTHWKGHHAVFYTPSDVAGTEATIHDSFATFHERLGRTAFDRTLERGDRVHACLNHDRVPLATNDAGTMILYTDAVGLVAEGILGNTAPARFVVEAMERGDIQEASIAFTVDDDGEDWHEEADGRIVRTITALTLIDVTFCFRGAYTGTSVGLRTKPSYTLKPARQQSVRTTTRGVHGELVEAQRRLQTRFDSWSRRLDAGYADADEGAKLKRTQAALTRLAIRGGLLEDPNEVITVRCYKTGQFLKIRRREFDVLDHVRC